MTNFSLLSKKKKKKKKIQFGIIYHTCVTAEIPKVTVTTVKTLQLSRSEIYANFTNPAYITHETGIFTALKVPQ